MSNGRLIAMQKTAPNSTLKLPAEKWFAGMYFIEVTQGSQRKVTKLVKLNKLVRIVFLRDAELTCLAEFLE